MKSDDEGEQQSTRKVQDRGEDVSRGKFQRDLRQLEEKRRAHTAKSSPS